jgi:hypothetical protein
MTKIRRPIRKPNIHNEDPAYWNRVLNSWGLPTEKGRPARVWENRGTPEETLGRVTSFMGDLNDLNDVQEKIRHKKSGKVNPSGHGPE